MGNASSHGREGGQRVTGVLGPEDRDAAVAACRGDRGTIVASGDVPATPASPTLHAFPPSQPQPHGNARNYPVPAPPVWLIHKRTRPRLSMLAAFESA